MANPQIENGYTPISNEVLQALAGIRIPGEATQVLFVILRKTYGFRKKFDRIPLSQFCEATGLLRPNVVRAIKVLISMNLISKYSPSSIKDDTGSIKNDTGSIKGDTGYITTYQFNKDFDSWRPVVRVPKGSIISDNEPVSKTIHSKETISKERKNIYTVVFEELWSQYPSKDGKIKALKHFNASVKGEKDVEDIRKALALYLSHLRKNTWKQPKAGSTWFYNWRDWVNWEESDGGNRQGSGKSGSQRQTSADRAAEIFMEIGQGGGHEAGDYKDISGL